MNTDKPYKLRIHVTKDVLKRSMMCGVDNLDTNCAIALAVREVFPRANVWSRNIWVANGRILLPEVATKFIRRFDRLKFNPERRLKLHELSFDVLVPPSVIDAIGLAEVKAIVEKSETLELV